MISDLTELRNAADDPRSLEENVAELKMPDVVEQPDEEKLQTSLANYNEKILVCDKRLVRPIPSNLVIQNHRNLSAFYHSRIPYRQK